MEHVDNCLASLIHAITQCVSHTTTQDDINNLKEANSSTLVPESRGSNNTAPINIGHISISDIHIVVNPKSDEAPSYNDRHDDRCVDHDDSSDIDKVERDARMRFFKANSP